MKTNYFMHEKQYRKRKENKAFGWADEELYAVGIAHLKRELPPLLKEAKILEIGCGNGVYSLWLAQQGYEVFGMDIAPTAIEWAKQMAEKQGVNAHFTVGNVLELDAVYPKDSFDFVLDGYCLHCIIGDDRQKLLHSVKKVLRPGGYFLLQTMCNEPVEEAVRGCYDAESRCMIVNGIAGRYFGKAENIKQELAEAGFTLETERIDKADQDTLYALFCADK